MDAHFDFNQFHPTFLSNDGWGAYSGFGEYFHVHMDDFLQHAYEFHLPSDVVHRALEDACQFIGIPEMDFMDSPIMAVDKGNPTSYEDDMLLFSRKQMEDMGIHDEKSLSLVCTHEVAHRLFQYLDSTNQLSTWQTELACDAVMGVRSVFDRIDIAPIKEALHNTYDDPSHPGFGLRYEYIDIGREIGEYLRDHDMPANAVNIMNRLRVYINKDSERILGMESRINQLSSMDTDNPNISAFTKEDVDYYAHQVRISSGSEREHWLERYNWALNHLSGFTSMPDNLTPEEWLKKSGYCENGHVLDGPNGQA